MGKDVCPVVPLVPGDPRGGVDLDGHHLAHGAALDEHDGRADPAGASAAFFATLDVGCHQGVAGSDVRAWDDVCALDCESVKIWVWVKGGPGYYYVLPIGVA